MESVFTSCILLIKWPRGVILRDVLTSLILFFGFIPNNMVFGDNKVFVLSLYGVEDFYILA